MNIFLSMRRATVMAGKRRTGRSASFNSPSSKGFSLDQRANSLSDIAKWQDGSILVKLRSVWCGRRKLNPHELVACQSPVIKQATLHEEQPPAAARARRFAAKNAPAGLRQIRINIRLEIGISDSLRQPPPRLRPKTASGDSRSARPVALTSLIFVVCLCRFRCLGLGIV